MVVSEGMRRWKPDYGNLIIHIFDREQRSFYSLERIWGDAKEC